MLLVGLLAVAALPVWAYQGGVGNSPYAADLLVSGLNNGSLDPGQEYWYAYSRMDLGDPNYNSVIFSLNFEADGVAVALVEFHLSIVVDECVVAFVLSVVGEAGRGGVADLA